MFLGYDSAEGQKPWANRLISTGTHGQKKYHSSFNLVRFSSNQSYYLIFRFKFLPDRTAEYSVTCLLGSSKTFWAALEMYVQQGKKQSKGSVITPLSHNYFRYQADFEKTGQPIIWAMLSTLQASGIQFLTDVPRGKAKTWAAITADSWGKHSLRFTMWCS